jgi:hypothetical protein
MFKLMEINDFKQLPHITLAFRPGNDTAVKQVCVCVQGRAHTSVVGRAHASQHEGCTPMCCLDASWNWPVRG